MTDQQPHMPLDGLVLRMHIHFGAANAAGDDYSADDFADVIRILENLAADIAAAEQRGATKALRDLADNHTVRIPDILGDRVQAVFTETIWEKLDDLEGDDETH